MELTLGILSGVQMFSFSSRSRISQANMVGFSLLYAIIELTTEEVATFGLEPPITPGLIEPVSKYLEEGWVLHIPIDHRDGFPLTNTCGFQPQLPLTERVSGHLSGYLFTEPVSGHRRLLLTPSIYSP